MVSHQTPRSGTNASSHIITASSFQNLSANPNHPALLIYRSPFPPTITATQNESHLSSLGLVSPQWRYTMYSTSHFHSTSHEVLGISSGRAKLCFGHEENPKRVEETVEKGDVIIMPAGVARRLLEDLEGGFEMVGCYPVGCSWDMCYGRAGEEGVEERIRGLGWFGRDPCYGDSGPVLEV